MTAKRGARSGGSLALFDKSTRKWFERAFVRATDVQERGWAEIAKGHHSLLIAPTGSGKTLAAFLWAIDRLSRRRPEAEPGVRTLYISPLKALAYDVERNLRAPLIGIERTASQMGLKRRPPRVAIRSGDTSPKERRMQAKTPSEILVTTPESLYLILGSQARETLRTVESVILDEVHALAPTKRGAHLSLSLERLAELCEQDFQRIGLSATARPIDAVARYLGGDRPVSIVDASRPPAMDLEEVVPVLDMTRPELVRQDEEEEAPPESGPRLALAEEQDPFDGPVEDEDFDPDGLDTFDFDDDPGLPQAPEMVMAEATELFGPEGEKPQHGIWPVMVPKLVELIEAHRTTIIFVNSRGLCERLVQRIVEEMGEEGHVRSHHGSLSQSHRRDAEEMLKAGRIKAIVATSSLELGIDMGTVDLVIMVESPGAVARGLQRVGRAGHGVGQKSKGRIFPKHRGDLLEATVVARRMLQGELEPLTLPRNPLDVLTQQVIAMCALEDRTVEEIERTVRRSASYHELPKDALFGVLDMASGRYPSADFADLKPRLTWDRDADTLSARRGTRMLAILSGGTIPDRGMYAVYLAGEGGVRVGELDEEMVHESQPGHVITLGASSWRVEEVTRDRVYVTPAPGEVGRLPFWRGAGPGRPIHLGQALGEFLRTIDEKPDDEVKGWLEEQYRLHPYSAENLIRYVRDQKEATGCIPSDRAIVVETFRDELGDVRICILTPFGSRVHAPWSLAIEAIFSRQTELEVQTLYTDDGICVRIADADELRDLPSLFPDPEEVGDLIVEQLGNSALFASHFRENAARALLLPRRKPGVRTPLWQQRLKSQQLLKVAREYPSFPIIVETYRECLQDVFDVPSLKQILSATRSREVRVEEVSTNTASPFAQSLVFAFVAAYLYEGDAPLAERRAQALSLDRNLLRELLGEDELRSLLDFDAIDALEAELQQLAPDRQAKHLDALHDMLRRLGALTEDEVHARCAEDPSAWIETLSSQRRLLEIGLGDARCWVAVEDVALYRDGVGAMPPAGVADAFLTPTDRALEDLVARYARTHGPFRAEAFAARHGVSVTAVTVVLRQLESAERVTRGSFRREGGGEWCDVEILRRIKRRTLAKLRGEVEPVDKATFARFLPAWHGLDAPRKGMARLEETICQLEGLPQSYAELEASVLPARVEGFRANMLDELGSMGFVVWVGHGSLGSKDGRIALYRRERVGRLLDPPDVEAAELSPLAQTLLGKLEQRGACFFLELKAACRDHKAHEEEIVSALWDLVWAGIVTNDTFQPLRALGMRRASRKGRRRGQDLRTAGRWSLVSELLDEVSPTERLHARAVMLLERHGIVSREAASLESLPGGFSAVYPVLKSMEEAGKVRRGYFVDGIGGAQFAFPGAVDRLRGMRQPKVEPQVQIISSPDPANPYGWVVPWPDLTNEGGRKPQRASGSLLVLVDGEPALYLPKGNKALITFRDVDPVALKRAFAALRDHLAQRSRKAIHIAEIDGEPALSSPHTGVLKELGLGFDHRGLLIERWV
ncbi:MAG: crosslink repair DNA glycosylase YcaQ family protein [Myxococcota bacterium]